MKGSRPAQATLTQGIDLSKTAATQSGVDGLNDHAIEGMEAFFAPDFRWMGNAGCGTKNGLREFQKNWQDNWVSVDFAHVRQQLGVDPFQGLGWEAYDRGEKLPPQPGDGEAKSGPSPRRSRGLRCRLERR